MCWPRSRKWKRKSNCLGANKNKRPRLSGMRDEGAWKNKAKMQISVEAGLLTHVKTKKAARLLGVPEYQVVGLMVSVWIHAANHDKDIFRADDLALLLDYERDYTRLFAALTDAGFLHERQGGYEIHGIATRRRNASAHEFSFPLVSGEEWLLPPPKLREWRATFPDVSVDHELARAAQWLRDNPDRRKTKRGITRFLSLWLSRVDERRSKDREERTQERGAPQSGPQYSYDVELD